VTAASNGEVLSFLSPTAMTTQMMRTVICSLVVAVAFGSEEPGALQIASNEFGDKKAGLREPCDTGSMKGGLKCPTNMTAAELARLALMNKPTKCTGCFSVPIPDCCRELRYHPGDSIRKSLDKAKFTRYMYELAMPPMDGATQSSTIKTLHKLAFDDIVSFQAVALSSDSVYGNSAPIEPSKKGYYVWLDETHFVVTRTSKSSELDDSTVRVYIWVDAGKP